MTKKRILIVDDDVDASGLLKFNLDGTGQYEVQAENSGSRGLATAREFRPDIVLLDVDMPDTDGGEVAFQIQADKSLRKTQILFLTSLVTDREAGALGLRSGGYQVIAKPVPLKTLVELIEGLLARTARNLPTPGS